MADVDYGVYEPAEIGLVMPEVRGIIVGGCVARGVGSAFRRAAHAHNYKDDEHFGWICVRSCHKVLTRPGQASRLMMHEYAHILTPGHGHDDAWRATMKRLGQPLPRHYAKQSRARRARGVTTWYHTVSSGLTHGPFESQREMLTHVAACREATR